jgi:hypothetical protein
MSDLIVRALLALCAWLFPATGRRRAVSPPQEAAPAAEQPRRRSHWLPTRMSPYAAEAAADRPFCDTPLLPERSYLDAPRKRPRNPEEMAQAERLWALDMATRGIDVGPSVIHGVHVGAGSRTVHVGVAV